MVDRKEKRISVRRQCQLLGLPRSSLGYEAKGEHPENLGWMRLIDELYLERPYYGVRKIQQHFRREGCILNEKRIRRLLRKMGLMAIYRKPKLSVKHPHHQVYPYLLKGVVLERPNQVWAVDITYIPMRRGFLYLVAIIDLYSRYVVSWQLSNTLDTEFCVRALLAAFAEHGLPEIINSDQGCQFTSETWLNELRQRGIKISMDGRGRALDNVFIERLWRSVKYESVYLFSYQDGIDAAEKLGEYFRFYNDQRPHDAHNGRTPAEIYLQALRSAA